MHSPNVLIGDVEKTRAPPTPDTARRSGKCGDGGRRGCVGARGLGKCGRCSSIGKVHFRLRSELDRSSRYRRTHRKRLAVVAGNGLAGPRHAPAWVPAGPVELVAMVGPQPAASRRGEGVPRRHARCDEQNLWPNAHRRESRHELLGSGRSVVGDSTACPP